MPESAKRKNIKQHKAKEENVTLNRSWAEDIPMSPPWWAPTSVVIMCLGLLLVVVFYLSDGHYPVPNIGNWNLAVGLGVSFGGFLMLLRWR